MKKTILKTINMFLVAFILCGIIHPSVVKAEDNTNNINIVEESLTMKKGETAKLTVENIEGKEVLYSSNNEKIAIVDNEGNVKGVGAGTTTVKAVLADADVDSIEMLIDDAKKVVSEEKNKLDEKQTIVDRRNENIKKVQKEFEEADKKFNEADNELEQATQKETVARNTEQEISDVYSGLLEKKWEAKDAVDEAKDAYDAELLNADSNIAKAQGEVDAAKAELTNVQNKVNSGSYGFFEWHEENSMAISYLDERLSIQETDASITEEMKTKLGQDGDATSLENMKKALELIPEGNALRASDNHNAGENKTALKVTDYLMAVAQVQTNASASTQGHTSWARVGENLAWGYNRNRSPYEGWYTDEKAVYDYYLEHPNATKAEVVEALGLPSEGFVQTGHYLNIANPKDEENRRYITTGFGVNTVISSYGTTHGQTFGASYTQAGTAYTVEEYTADFNEYYNSIESELATAEQNVTEKETALTTLKNNNGVKEDIANAYRDAQDALASIEAETKQLKTQLETAMNERKEAEEKKSDAKAKYDEAYENRDDILKTLNQNKESLKEEEAERDAAKDSNDIALETLKDAQAELDKVVDTVEVIVIETLVTNIKLNAGSATVYKGYSYQIKTTVYPSDALNKTVTYKSSNTKVATVDKNGKVSGKANGTATITVTANDGSGKKATVKVTVKTVKARWVKSGKQWMYLNGNNTYSKNKWQKISGKWYHFNSKGIMQTGWIKVGGKWYYLKSSGVMQTGWKKLSNKWYYLDENGVMKTGFQTISKKKYYFNGSGIMATGWKKISNKWYYMGGNGAVRTGWKKIGGKEYYFYSSGIMASNTWIDKYYVNGSGVYVKGAVKSNGNSEIYSTSTGCTTKTEKKLVKEAWSEKVLVTPGHYENVLVKEAWEEKVPTDEKEVYEMPDGSQGWEMKTVVIRDNDNPKGKEYTFPGPKEGAFNMQNVKNITRGACSLAVLEINSLGETLRYLPDSGTLMTLDAIERSNDCANGKISSELCSEDSNQGGYRYECLRYSWEKTIEHPAEYKKVWVEPVYKTVKHPAEYQTVTKTTCN